MLGGLQRHPDPGQRAELPGPHPGGVDDHLGLDLTDVGQHPGNLPAPGPHAGHRDALDHPRAELPGALGQRGRDADRIGAALVGDVERGQHVVGPGQRPHPGQLPGRDLGVLHAEAVHPGGLAAQRLLAALAGRHGDVPDRAEPGRVPGLCLQPRVQVARVAAEEQGGLVGHPGRGDQPGGVPGGPGGELVLLDQHDVGPAEVGQVVGDAAAGHPAADDDGPRPARQARVCPRLGHRALALAPWLRSNLDHGSAVARGRLTIQSACL